MHVGLSEATVHYKVAELHSSNLVYIYTLVII